MKDKWGRKDIDDGNELTLKTLKDLREDIIKILREAKCPNPKATAEFIIERKRAEAIKWVKIGDEELKEEGWNDDIIDETNLLFKKYRMEKINDD